MSAIGQRAGRSVAVLGVIAGLGLGVVAAEVTNQILGKTLTEIVLGTHSSDAGNTRPHDSAQQEVSGQSNQAELVDVKKELEEYKARLADAAKEIERLTHVTSKGIPSPEVPREEGQESTTITEGSPAADEKKSDVPSPSQWRISAIEKFLPLTAEQRSRLEESYRVKESGGEGETLEQIVGVDNAKYYREQVSNAFRKVAEQELEKEVVFTARKLGLTADQESRLREVFSGIESEIGAADQASNQGAAPKRGSTPAERVKQMVEESKRRNALRAERVKDTLTPEQYQQFLKDQAESPDSDMQVFHDSGDTSSNGDGADPRGG